MSTNTSTGKLAAISELIRSRRSVFPKQYQPGELSRATIEQLLENASWAPNHKKTEPWRFKVVQGAALERLGQHMAARYREISGDNFNPAKYEKTLHNPPKAAAVIGLCMQRDPAERLPEWEEIAAVSCAAQNIMLTCEAMDLGCYWSSPATIVGDTGFFELEAGETCLGLLYIGHWERRPLKVGRQAVNDKTTWINS